MQNDLYTKAILTLIALSLSAIAVQILVTRTAAADVQVSKVTICVPKQPDYWEWNCGVGASGNLLQVRTHNSPVD